MTATTSATTEKGPLSTTLRCCPNCGYALDYQEEPVVKRGAIVVRFDPIFVTWRDQRVRLSPVEAELFARIARRGRITFSEIDRVLGEIGAVTATRSVVLFRIRKKFRQLGSCNPLERQGDMIRLRVDPDEDGEIGPPIIGLRMARHATAKSPNG